MCDTADPYKEVITLRQEIERLYKKQRDLCVDLTNANVRIKELEAENIHWHAISGSTWSDYINKIVKVESERDKLQQAIEEAILHLSTNYDCDGNRMDGSDAFEILQKALKGE